MGDSVGDYFHYIKTQKRVKTGQIHSKSIGFHRKGQARGERIREMGFVPLSRFDHSEWRGKRAHF